MLLPKPGNSGTPSDMDIQVSVFQILKNGPIQVLQKTGSGLSRIRVGSGLSRIRVGSGFIRRTKLLDSIQVFYIQITQTYLI